MRYQDKKKSPVQKSNRDLEGDLESCSWDKKHSSDQKYNHDREGDLGRHKKKKSNRDLEGDLKSCSRNKRYSRNSEGNLRRHHVVQILLHRPYQQMTLWNK